MFQPIPMQHVTLYMMREDAALGALALAESGVFSPYEETSTGSALDERPGAEYRARFEETRQRLEKILVSLDLRLDLRVLPGSHVVNEQELQELAESLADLWHECSRCEEQARHLEDKARETDQLINLLTDYLALDIDLSWLQGRFRFLDVHVGTVPLDNLARLNSALGLLNYTLTSFSTHDNFSYVVAAGLHDSKGELNTVLATAGFRKVVLPPEFRDHPQKVLKDLQQRRHEIEEQQNQLREAVARQRDQNLERLTHAAQTLVLAAPYARLADGLHGKGGLTQVKGWVPHDRVDELKVALQERLGERCVVEAREPTAEERAWVPSALRHPRFVRPFASLVKNYGVPRYGEIDPTWLFALTFVLMFGMMFGDIGHGLLIAIAAAVFHEKLKGFAPFGIAAGISSVFFGFLYGSVFGFEEIIHPLWRSPLSDPNLMLTLALYWGIGFLLLANGIRIRNNLAEGRVQQALFEGNGLFGVLLYLGLLFAAYRWLGEGRFGPLEKTLIVAPLVAVLIYQWHQVQAPLAERLLVTVIEAFETVIGYVTNTLSFLRVAAFSLNHVALAIAVFTLADMMDQVGHWITVVFGNVFILVLEGAIVAIQVLRLEYYEGFSRFFGGDGQEFQPLALERRAPARAGLRDVKV